LYEESLTINRGLGDREGIAYLLQDIGSLAALQGQAERALRLSGAMEELRQQIGAPLPPAELVSFEKLLEAARQDLGEAAAASVIAKGRAMSLEEAIDYAFQTD
jgi:hypothetical protein